MPRFMMIIKGDFNPETDAMDPSVFQAMSDFNDRLIEAGVMLAGEGLHYSAQGARITNEGGVATVTDGPFAESKELVAGFWILRTDSLQDAIEWGKQVPGASGNETYGNTQGFNLEIRQIHDVDDFGAELSEELREKERAQRLAAGSPLE